MKTHQLIKILDEISPFELQEGWDNSGLQVGDLDSEVGEISLCIDLDEELLDSIPENSTIITHHPLIFGSLKRVEANEYPAKFIKKLIIKNINLISMHTNYDKTHLNEYVAKYVLEWEDYQSTDFIIKKEINISFNELIVDLKEKFQLKEIKYSKVKENIKTIALTTGAGASFAKKSGVDAYITGDVKYHDAMEAKAMGVSLIDVTHYSSEKFFANSLQKELKNLDINGIIRDLRDPFIQI